MKKTTFFKKSSTFNEVVNTPKEVNSVILIEQKYLNAFSLHFFFEHQVNIAQPQLCLIENSIFLNFNVNTRYDYRLKMIFRSNPFIWYVDFFSEIFQFLRFYKFSLRFYPNLRLIILNTYKLYAYKKSVLSLWFFSSVKKKINFF